MHDLVRNKSCGTLTLSYSHKPLQQPELIFKSQHLHDTECALEGEQLLCPRHQSHFPKAMSITHRIYI